MEDFALHVGVESTYGTPVVPTRSFETQADGHKRQQEFLESRGARSGIQTIRSDRRRAINMGAEGTIPQDVLNKGMGILLKAALGTSTIAQQGVTAAYLQTHSTARAEPADSLTVQIPRPFADAGEDVFDYHGGVVAGWKVTQESDGLLVLELTMDYEDEVDGGTEAAAAYPSAASPFAWPDCVVTVNGIPFDADSIEIEGDNALVTDRRKLRGSALKKRPRRPGIGIYTGALEGEFVSTADYDHFVAGDIVPIVATWTGDTIESPHDFYFKVTMAACQFDGDTPEASLDDMPVQSLPFKVLHNGTDPAVKIEYMSSDTAY